MKIGFLGDSITEGAVATSKEKQYTALVGKLLNAQSYSYGVGGSRIAKQKVSFNGYTAYDEYFYQRALKMRDDLDLVFVFGGTNDFGHGDAMLGNKNDLDDDTFYGACNHLFSYLINRYGKNNVIVILPIPRGDENSSKGEFFVAKKEGSPVLKVYRDIIYEVANSYGLKTLDFSNEIGKVDDGNIYISSDHVHPNDLGHELIANLIVKYIKTR